MADLLDQMNAAQQTKAEDKGKSSESSVAEQTSGATIVGNEGSVPGAQVGDDLTNKAAEAKPDAQAAASTGEEVSKRFDDASTWTKESALLEVKKTREEAKQSRLMLKEQEAKFKAQMDELKSQMDEKLQTATQAQQELEARKAAEEDKKRSMEEKLAHRESMVKEYEMKLQAIEADNQKKLEELNSRVSTYEAEREAQLTVYKERINEELQQVPESKRTYAEMIIKGHEDPRDAWAALSEAKMDGMFEDKQVVVSHATPGADAARMTKEKLDAAAAEARKNMKSTDLIRQGLKDISNDKGTLRGKIV